MATATTTAPAASQTRFKARLGQYLTDKVSAWARKRQGQDQNPFTLTRRRLYILPTRTGIAFAALVFAMLLGSLNYAASLGFALTFLLCGVGLVCMHHAHRNLLGIELRYIGAQPVFAGEAAQFRIALHNPANRTRYELELFAQAQRSIPHDVGHRSDIITSLPIMTTTRGLLKLDRFGIATHHPAGLFRTWSWAYLALECVVYPQPAAPGRAVPVQREEGAEQWSEDHGEADFAGLRSFAPGDPPRRVAWKAYARSDVLLIKQFSGSQTTPLLMDWDSLPNEPLEARLSQLTRWCLDAHEQGARFGLKVPGHMVKPNSGVAHLDKCLTILALFDSRQHG